MATRTQALTGRDEIFFMLGRMCEQFGLGDALRYVEEIADSPLIPEFEKEIADVASFETKQFAGGPFDFRLFRLALYTLVREVRPNIMMETGVLHGMTSAFVLEAMEMNARGKLISVDLPSSHDSGPANSDGINAVLPQHQKSGWLVSKRLAPRWQLELGSSLEVLPRMFAANPEIDMFLHDSDHVYPVMWQEMCLAWDHMREGGFLICDNIDFSRAFFDFCRRVGRLPFVLSAPDTRPHPAIRFGMLRK